MRKLLFFTFSLVLSAVLIYLAYFVQVESLVVVTNITIVLLFILNTLANIFQVIGFLQSFLVPKSTENINYRRGSEILTPLYVGVKNVKTHIEGFRLDRIDLELWRMKKNEYLFLTMRREMREFINNFYGNVEQYDTRLERFKTLVQGKISSTLYDYCAGIIVAPVDWETGQGFDSKFNDFCKQIAQEICNVAVTIALKSKSVSSLQPRDFGVLQTPLFNLLRKSSSFSYLVGSDDPEVIGKSAAEHSTKFADSVFKSIFKENSLREIRNKREKIIEEATELIGRLDSEIRRTS